MPKHSETRQLPYLPEQMFDLVADVAKYPEFLPWCAAARIRDRRAHPKGEQIDADLVISFQVFREKFTSRVTLDKAKRTIDVEYLDGPFKYLLNEWRFEAADAGCRVDFHVDFEFRSKILQSLIGLVFFQAMQRIVRAFEDRAADLYGTGGQ